jgi:hypothetical protein
MPSPADHLDAPPPEVGVGEAAKLLDVDAKTVRRYIADGVLPYRNIAPPSSSRTAYRLRLADVMAMRMSYRIDQPAETPLAKPCRRAAAAPTTFKHITMRRSA